MDFVFDFFYYYVLKFFSFSERTLSGDFIFHSSLLDNIFLISVFFLWMNLGSSIIVFLMKESDSIESNEDKKGLEFKIKNKIKLVVVLMLFYFFKEPLLNFTLDISSTLFNEANIVAFLRDSIDPDSKTLLNLTIALISAAFSVYIAILVLLETILVQIMFSLIACFSIVRYTINDRANESVLLLNKILYLVLNIIIQSVSISVAFKPVFTLNLKSDFFMVLLIILSLIAALCLSSMISKSLFQSPISFKISEEEL